MAQSRDDELWALAHAERAALAEDLAHLTAAASLNQWQWLRSMLGARFRPAVHNQRRLDERRGRTPAETLDKFRAVVTSTTAPSSHTAAYLGEVVVHAQDIRQPLGLARTPGVGALTPVADFFASRNFAVPSHTHVAGLQLRADPRTRDDHGRPRALPGRARRPRRSHAAVTPAGRLTGQPDRSRDLSSLPAALCGSPGTKTTDLGIL